MNFYIMIKPTARLTPVGRKKHLPAPLMTIESTGKNADKSAPAAPWPSWRVRLARLSPYTLEINEQLDRLYQLTIALTIVPGIMAAIILTLLTAFGRPDIGLIAILIIFGPIIALAWRDYRRIARQARAYLASIEPSNKSSREPSAPAT